MKSVEADEAIALLERYADQSANGGFYGLQDANLILAETLRELSSNVDASKSVTDVVSAWTGFLNKFKESPRQTVQGIIEFLRLPELNIPLADEEFSVFEEQLTGDAERMASQGASAVTAAESPNPIGFKISEQDIANVLQLADQAASDGLYGLQDAHLLLAESLQEIINSGQTASSVLAAALANWPDLDAIYRKQPQSTAPALISFLQVPELNTPLLEEEFAALHDRLVSEANAETEIHPVAADPTVATSVTVLESEPKKVKSKPKANSKGQVSRVAQELIDLLLMETGQIRNFLQDIVIGDESSTANGLADANEELERFTNAAKTAGFEGLAQLAAHIIANVQLFQEQVGNFTSERLDLVLDWLDQVDNYLPDFTDHEAGQFLIMGLTDEEWALPLPPEDMAAILLQIRTEAETVDDGNFSRRAQVANEDDVSLALPDDVNQELLDLLLQELPTHTQQFSEAVQNLLSGNGTEKDVLLAQRLAHTLKGSANTVGIRGIATLTHQLEDILIACSNEQKLPTKSLANSLINAADCLEAMSDALLGLASPPVDAIGTLQEILDWANRIDAEGLPESGPDDVLPEEQARPDMPTPAEEQAEAETAQVTVVRMTGDQVETLFRGAGESIILNSQAQETAKRMRGQLKAMWLQFETLQQLGAELEQLIDLRDLTGRSFVSIGTGFDSMEMDQYNELHTASRRMAEAAVDAREISRDMVKELDKMDGFLEDQQRQIIESQEVVMQTRLVSIATIAPRLQRSLRQTCRMTGKQCDLTLVGENLLVDGDTLNAMVDPLMHILRNAVDHGIESPEERLEHGKNAIGHLKFQFEREGNNFLIRCGDDGRGLDFAAIRKAAVKRGIIKAKEDISEEELKRFILRPNFTSRTVSTQTSGRGVGMDVVRAQVADLGGTINMESIEGKGMVFELRVPLPLSLTHALLTKVGRHTVAIADKGISQIIYSSIGSIFVDEKGEERLAIEEETYPTARLINLLHVADSRKKQQQADRSFSAVLLVEDEGATKAVLLETIIDNLEVVIKGLGSYIGKIPGYIGATILGDGSVTPVLDIVELLRVPEFARQSAELPATIQEHTTHTPNLPTVLVVDDSLSQRRALEQLLSDAGFRVRSARDGIEAAETLANFVPDAVLTDLEMPRMNGIELSSHIRMQSKTKHLPVIMITSRTTQKHREMADEAGIDAYFTKPVQDHELLIELTQLIEAGTKKKDRLA